MRITTLFPSRRAALAVLVASAAVLAGCASGPREISSNVQSYASMAQVQLPASYRLELLPSQSQQPSFTHVEAAAEQALRRVGLTRDPRPDLARLVVQVGATATQGRAYYPGYYDPFYGPRWGWGLGYGGRGGWGMGMGWSMMDTPPLVYYRAVKLVLRDQQTQQIVYETSAEYDEVRMNDDVIWGVLFDAALTGFPHPPQGPRQVRTVLTPLPPPAAASAPAATAPAPQATPTAPATPTAAPAAAP